MNKKNRNRKRNRKEEIQSKIIRGQIEEIEGLRSQILALEDEVNSKEEMADMADDILYNMEEISAMFDDYREEYKSIMNELIETRKVLNEFVFDGRYKLFKRLFFGRK